MLEEEIFNPRYPHTIRIVRKNTSLSGINADPDDPLAEPVKKSACGCDDMQEEEVLYEGIGRSFTDTTTNGNVEVDTNKRKASIPVRYDEWGVGEKPLDGDTIYATVGNNTEIGRVRDCEPDNNRTLVYWDFVRV